MAATPTVYVICDQNCKFEGMTKEQILTAIAQAVETGTIGDLDTGFITTIKTINGTPLKFFVGEQAEYDALTAEEKEGLFAIITNDATKAGLLEAIKDLQTNYNELHDSLADGSFVVEKANTINSNEKHYFDVGTEGKAITSLQRGKTYIISAMIGEHVSNERDTFIIHLPNDSGQFGAGVVGSSCYSTPSMQGYHVFCVYNNPWDLYFVDSSGATVAAEYVTIREI